MANTEKQESRYEELWEKAKRIFLENTDTCYIIDMLDDDEQKEYWKLCDEESHIKVKTTENVIIDVFVANERVYPIKEYLMSPSSEIYLPRENIIEYL
jgi:hypothetical protein